MNIECNDKVSEKTLFEKKESPDFKRELKDSRTKRVPDYNRLNESADYIERFRSVMEGCEITVRPEERFVYFLDFDYVFDNNRGVVFDNISADYRKIVDFGLCDLKYTDKEAEGNEFCCDYNKVIDAVVRLAARIADHLEQNDRRADWFRGIGERGADGFEEALQRVLFLNQILWQTNHPLMGFGLLDTMLDKVYEGDKKNGAINRESATEMIVDFYRILHRYFWFKSHALLGDTGQLVIVGRTGENGEYWYNDLTWAFIDGMRIANLPDPKVMLRVSSKTPPELIRCAVECIATGVGCPLFANDDVIIPRLIDDGIDPTDAFLYATAACWEPLIAWKCPISNNLTVLNYMRSMENLFLRDPLDEIADFETFFERYCFYLKRNVNAAKNSLSLRRFAYDPLISVFVGGCRERKRDVSAGGAYYNDYGMTTVAISNTVNAMINIRKMVFEEKRFSLQDVRRLILTNFREHDSLVMELKDNKAHFGTEDSEVRRLTNQIIAVTCAETEDFRNYMGGKLKFGLSSPAYIDAGNNTRASFDGRYDGEPFHVHISTTEGEAYTELVNFASSIKLEKNSYNGNVVDFITTSVFINDHIEKFCSFVTGAIRQGIFEMQIGVQNSKTLIEARRNPDAFPNLIVRVWGFSTYFKDLPEEYRDVVIQRALNNERRSA